MGQTRKIAVCMNCQDAREIVSHGLCDSCRKARDRKLDRDASWDERKHRQKQRKDIFAIVNVLDNDNGTFSLEDEQEMRRIIQPYYANLSPQSSEDDGAFDLDLLNGVTAPPEENESAIESGSGQEK